MAKKLPLTSSCKLKPVKPTQVHLLVQLWVSTVLTSWNSVRLSTPILKVMEAGLPTPVIITVYSDRSFTFVTKTPPASVLLKKAAGLTSGTARPNTVKVGNVTRAQLEDIAKTKMADLTAADMDAAVRTIAGSARSMGLERGGCVMAKLTKRQNAIAEKIEAGKAYNFEEAVALLAELSTVKFAESSTSLLIWVLTRVNPTRSFVALLRCHTALVRPFALLCSPRVQLPRPLWRPALTV